MNAHHLRAARWPFVRPIPSLLDDLFPPNVARDGNASMRPLMNVWSDDSALHVEAELPGMAIDDIDLTVLGDQLTLTGKRSIAPVEGATMIHEERRPGAFERRVQLPFEVQGDAVSAELLHGVLHVTLPKSEEIKPRRIPVRIAGE